MKRIALAGIVLVLGLFAAPVSADIIPIGTISSVADGANFDYTITLTNSAASTNVIGTFWFAWIPGDDFLPTNPIAGGFTTPAGWTLTVTHFPNVPTNGYALQWVASSTLSDIAIGSSLTFGFKSADTPEQIAGNSPFFPTIPVLTSFVYHGAPFSDAGVRFLVRGVPEPGSLSLCALGGIGLILARRRKTAIGK
jgi:hypothetical protein